MSEQSLAGMQFLIQEGRRLERERIIKLLESRIDLAKSTYGVVTAMRVPVEPAAVEAITEALIYAIKGGQNDAL